MILNLLRSWSIAPLGFDSQVRFNLRGLFFGLARVRLMLAPGLLARCSPPQASLGTSLCLVLAPARRSDIVFQLIIPYKAFA